MFGMFRLQRLSKHPDNTGKQWIRISFTDILIHHYPPAAFSFCLLGTPQASAKCAASFCECTLRYGFSHRQGLCVLPPVALAALRAADSVLIPFKTVENQQVYIPHIFIIRVLAVTGNVIIAKCKSQNIFLKKPYLPGIKINHPILKGALDQQLSNVWRLHHKESRCRPFQFYHIRLIQQQLPRLCFGHFPFLS